MALKKFKDWEGNNLDVYKIKDASDVGVGLTRHEWQGERTATQVGTTITADIMNELQKGLVHSIETIKKTESGKEIYEINLNGIGEFGLFKGLKLLLEIKSGNQTNNVFIRIKNEEYQIQKNQDGTLGNLEADDLKTNEKYFVEFNGTQFVIINILNYATEQKNGIAKIYSEAEANTDITKIENLVKNNENETAWDRLIEGLNHTKIVTIKNIARLFRKVLKPATETDQGLITEKKVKDLASSVIPEASETTAGKVRLGTTVNTALEGKRLAEIIGLEFGGNIQDFGNKIKGKFYYDTVTKFYYECIANTNLTYNESSKFRAISNKPISDRIENYLIFGKNTIKYPNGVIVQFGKGFAGALGSFYRNVLDNDFKEIYSVVAIHDGSSHNTNIAINVLGSNTFDAYGEFPIGPIKIFFTAYGRWK
ncbi:hypothetical protein AB8B23_03365 [Leptotrichia sp. HSP-342]|uniref:Uncharacterized protein n=1 Tax=Leptotrichia mesophila TaxID=3239303 RepID=A0AB39VCF0_9FUSO